ncbi:MAG: tRNA-dihydrouridine synthase C [Planctomycetota bacterium]|jgi:tRNA-dihydrouridine synthase C
MPALPFTAPWLLAPMEGVTDPTFRDVVLARHSPEHLGGAFTEFLRILDRPRYVREIQRHLGPTRWAIPVGVQLMGADLAALGESAVRAADLGVPLVDLNFGCPAKGALRGCAGSAQLKDPPGLERVVASVVKALDGRLPVSAKLRAGFDDASQLEDLVHAAEAGGADLISLHCRTKREAYQPEVDWTRIERAVGAVQVPVCGNGSVHTHADLERMRRETGCAYVMVGRAALGNPWIFSGEEASSAQAARFLCDYYDMMRERSGAAVKGAVSRVKQLFRHWTAGGLVRDEAERKTWLREQDPEALMQRVRSFL